MKKFFAILVVYLIVFNTSLLYTQNSKGKFWLQFRDKHYTTHSLNNPAAFLSQRAIERRERQQISIDSSDLPVSSFYLDSLKKMGLTILNTSKWMNAVTIDSLPYGISLDNLMQLSFISDTQQVYYYQTEKEKKTDKFAENEIFYLNNRYLFENKDDYGPSKSQIQLHNGTSLHNKGYKGYGMIIAILDAGFYKANEFEAFKYLFDNNNILITKDFVDGGSNVYDDHYHGTSVLSTMGAVLPGKIIGTAPEANYLLLRSENAASEFIIEEDNWIAAAEFADSIGADIINTSLGYSTFDIASQNHSYQEMDGNTTRISKAADIASKKGMLVVVSAGNEGDSEWKHITAPADADSVLSVGAVDSAQNPAYFSSYGPAFDGDVKPNIAAMGFKTIVQNPNGEIGPGNGTSYSAPIISGLAACLWQAHPQISNINLLKAIEQSASFYPNYDSLRGYGIPDFNMAHLLLNDYEERLNNPNRRQTFLAYPNPFTSEIFLEIPSRFNGNIFLSLNDISGQTWLNKKINLNSFYYKLLTIPIPPALNSGLYILKIKTPNNNYKFKLIKNKHN
jgi:hypothetical protein